MTQKNGKPKHTADESSVLSLNITPAQNNKESNGSQGTARTISCYLNPNTSLNGNQTRDRRGTTIVGDDNPLRQQSNLSLQLDTNPSVK